MRRGFLVFFLLVVSVFAKENYSQMSTQELIEIIGFVDEKDKVSFQKELEFRIPKMSSFEREQYEKRLNETPEIKVIEDEE
ncbi:DUF1104 domain-containing protein [Aliarcobacter cibarius]|jgi:hypothetical protein|uniref:DUF1104 domain-containing protein n=1 Tax=Aliarcobacter cibarius TaxID=255507 RepID=A0A5J6RJ21_9BACT|nr:hypothetical protein ACIB15232_1285 [Aliarcobacter cibarius]QKJ27386.1 DUF1104 domain-containing protein [Aliarcobacter cibarius]TLS97066.1 DUF1104 domain-containing protein [Aliarcobacter cibarius]TLS97550.1 DUF1104 domain-containing protein [Aliarcobacter cibarius]TLT04278.1 DUF1104 domain-containing protein [Aliarcobacter cibarius]